MNVLKTKTFILLLTAIWLMSFASAMAEEQSRITLSVENLDFTVGQEVSVDVMVENMPQVYGADVELTFDPQVLEVVDADENLPGVQLQGGDFINAEQGFFLQNEVNNQAGVIDYALTLLNPAPPAEGNGVLATIVFRAKVDGQTKIDIQTSEFGTQTGEVIPLVLNGIEIGVGSIGGGQNEGTTDFSQGSSEVSEDGKDAEASSPEIPFDWLLIGGGLIVVFILIFLIQSVQMARIQRKQ